MIRRPAALPRPEPPAPFVPQEFRILFCFQECEEWTEHHLTVDGDYYICRECGGAMIYIISARPTYLS